MNEKRDDSLLLILTKHTKKDFFKLNKTHYSFERSADLNKRKKRINLNKNLPFIGMMRCVISLCEVVKTPSEQQWTIGPVDREIVPLSAEMDHPT
jgi:hypothetical protein